MKKVSLIGILVAVLMVAMVAMPVFAWTPEDWDVVSVTSSEDWISNQSGADASSTSVSITVKNDIDSWLLPLGKVDADSLTTNASGLTIGAASPSGWQQVNDQQTKTFTYTIGVGTAADGMVDVDADFDTKYGSRILWWDVYFNGSGINASANDLFGVDSTSPTATIGITQTGGTATLNNSYNDNLSGVNSYTILVDGQPYTGSISGIGLHRVEYTVTDNAGNQTTGIKYVPVNAWFAGNPNGTPHQCAKCGAILQCAWLSSQYMQPGFYGWDLSVPGGQMWGVCKCGNGK